MDKWIDRNLMKYNKGKCQVLYLRRNNPIHQYMLGDSQMESSFAEKDLGVLMDTKMNMRQKCANGEGTASWAVTGIAFPAGEGR